MCTLVVPKLPLLHVIPILIYSIIILSVFGPNYSLCGDLSRRVRQPSSCLTFRPAHRAADTRSFQFEKERRTRAEAALKSTSAGERSVDGGGGEDSGREAAIAGDNIILVITLYWIIICYILICS